MHGWPKGLDTSYMKCIYIYMYVECYNRFYLHMYTYKHFLRFHNFLIRFQLLSYNVLYRIKFVVYLLTVNYLLGTAQIVFMIQNTKYIKTSLTV